MAYINHSQGRRNFLRRAASLSAMSGGAFALNLMGVGAAAAQTSGDFKALVCIFLAGGNDQSNTIVPVSNSAYAAYQNARPSLALVQGGLLPINPVAYSGEPLGLHPNLSAIKPLFDQGRVALMANVGALARPITQAQWNQGVPTVDVPQQLFSHSDQTAAWQTGLPDRASQTGWQGRMGDLLTSAYNSGSGVSMAISLSGINLMQAGNTMTQYPLSTQGAIKVGALNELYGSAAGAAALRRMITESRTHLMEAELNTIGARAIATETLVSNALVSSQMNSSFPNTGLGRQLAMVARMLAARGPLAQRRQLFFVQQGGYDFHDNLVVDQAARLRELADAMAAFYQATAALGVASQVTTFTASDFGRALQYNGRGSDHGWGGHHFVMGGAVQGNRVYGEFPTVALGGPEDALQGRLIPTTSVDEYTATLARWFGVSDSQLPTVLPNIGRFASRNLGFMGPLA